MTEIPLGRWGGNGALAIYCVSCVPMAAMSIVPLAATLGVAGARTLSTPLDGFLDAWGLPLLVVSVASLLYFLRRSPRAAFGLVAAGGALTIAAMLAMGPVATGQDDAPADMGDMAGMSDMTPAPSGDNADLRSALAFWVGAGLVLGGYLWAWRAARLAHRATPVDALD